ncbi:MAG: hypothetical protein ABW051_08675 [Burkholderiaceae bacterium]
MSPIPDPTAPGPSEELLTATTDLKRLQALLGDATATLLSAFVDASGGARALPESPEAARVRAALSRAMVAMQFEDMATQLITHVNRRLRSVSEGLAQQPWPALDAGQIVFPVLDKGACPVIQTGMGAGRVEFF